ncbi:MAG: hypothetical protein PHU25_07620 [Deltaproteobacteria bacterium]|nr:hypothetical protein [Deltaproteobacteria bacterium]
MRLTSAGSAFAACLLCVSIATASQKAEQASSSPTPGAETHDGFLFRVMAGGGYAGLYQKKASTDKWDWTHLGGGGVNLSFGGSPVNNLSLYFETALNFPQLFAAGFGIGGYVAGNVFIDGSIGYSFMVNEYAALTLGKEWWTSDEWGLGLALRETVAGALPRFPGGVMMTTFLFFTATYN